MALPLFRHNVEGYSMNSFDFFFTIRYTDLKEIAKNFELHLKTIETGERPLTSWYIKSAFSLTICSQLIKRCWNGPNAKVPTPQFARVPRSPWCCRVVHPFMLACMNLLLPAYAYHLLCFREQVTMQGCASSSHKLWQSTVKWSGLLTEF